MRGRPRRRADPAHGHATALHGPIRPAGMIPRRARGYREALATRATSTTTATPGRGAARPKASHPHRLVAQCSRSRGSQAADTSARQRTLRRTARGRYGRLRTAGPETADGRAPIARPGLRQVAGRRRATRRRRPRAGGLAPAPAPAPAPGRLTARQAGQSRARRRQAARRGQAALPGGRARSPAATSGAAATPGGRPPNPGRRAPRLGGLGRTGRHAQPWPGGRSKTQNHRRAPLDGPASIPGRSQPAPDGPAPAPDHSQPAPDGRPRGLVPPAPRPPAPRPPAPRPAAPAPAAMPHRSDRRETMAGRVPGVQRPVPRLVPGVQQQIPRPTPGARQQIPRPTSGAHRPGGLMRRSPVGPVRSAMVTPGPRAPAPDPACPAGQAGQAGQARPSRPERPGRPAWPAGRDGARPPTPTPERGAARRRAPLPGPLPPGISLPAPGLPAPGLPAPGPPAPAPPVSAARSPARPVPRLPT